MLFRRHFGDSRTGAQGYSRRDEVVIATKVFFPMSPGQWGGLLARRYSPRSTPACAGSDGVRDLYQIHRWDPHTPIEETLEALHDVVKSGKVRYLARPPCTPGSSASPAYRAPARMDTFVSMQNLYNLSTVRKNANAAALCGCGHRSAALEPWPGAADPRMEHQTDRARTDIYGDKIFPPTARRSQSGRAVTAIASARKVPRRRSPLPG